MLQNQIFHGNEKPTNAVEVRLNEKADQLELDDFDLKVVTERLERYLCSN
ncbi:hypothetical protein ACTGWR_04080 [Streptococcus suis]